MPCFSQCYHKKHAFNGQSLYMSTVRLLRGMSVVIGPAVIDRKGVCHSIITSPTSS